MNEDEFRRAVEGQMRQECLTQQQLAQQNQQSLANILMGNVITNTRAYGAGALDWREVHRPVPGGTSRSRGAYIGKVTPKPGYIRDGDTIRVKRLSDYSWWERLIIWWQRPIDWSFK